MSFGYSIGDLIAIAGLIERIVVEVKSYKEAPHHFQRLAIELDFLSKVCHQAFHLVSSRVDEQARLERVRAIALQCLGPLQEFEEKMRRYENTLGPKDCSDNSRKGWVRSFKKRLHWSAIARHEVDELRAILTSEILAINTLLTMQNWESLRPGNTINNPFTDHLKALIITTQTASREIETCLVEAKAGSERLEKLVVAANLAQTENENTLKLVKENTEKTSSILDAVTDTMGVASSQLVRLFSLTEHLEIWIRTVVQYCNEISILSSEILTFYSQSTFENPFGIKMALPFQMCDTWEGLCRLLVVMFYNNPGLRLVERRRFVVMQSRTNMPIKPEHWSTSVVPGDSLNMSILLERLGSQSTGFACPRCDYVFDSISSSFRRRYQCPKCLLWSDTTDEAQLGISSDSSSLTVPVPPPEPVNWDSWTVQWRSRFLRPQALSRLRNSGMPFDRSPSSNTDDEDVDVSVFRRVHVIPFDGDLLRSLVRIGSECRDLVLNYSSHFEPNNPRLPPETVVEFKRLVQELNELKATGIYPLAELNARQSTKGHKEVLEQWIKRTAQVVYHSLADPLLRARVSHDEITEISQWLSNPAPLPPAASTPSRAKFTLDSFCDDYCRNQYFLRFAPRKTKVYLPSTQFTSHDGSECRLLFVDSDESYATTRGLKHISYKQRFYERALTASSILLQKVLIATSGAKRDTAS
ncbi:hypothetical protein FAGAP_4185 [Fusarium agapanthi]|uniref:Ubiquitin-like domain-containing protein n=1 Tax=Fusarium agapanthi TaxID=1803897 RepID=A0A9P5BCF5_9HYPO|nr:hypothetical protein FAGAP_4185 [Fusarium agapanthi]